MDPKKLSDDELWAKTRTLAADERRLTLEVLRHLREVEARGLHFDRGYPSLYEYAVRELRYSEGSAYRRIQAMRLLKDVPELEEKIEQGKLNLTTVTKVQSAYKNSSKEEKRSLLVAMEGRTSKEVDQALLDAAIIKSFRETTRWLAPDTIELRLFLDKISFQSLDTLKAIKSHVRDTDNYSGIVKKLIELGIERWNPLRRTASSQRRSIESTTVESSDTRYIPAELRRRVWARDQSRCSFIPANGVPCRSTHFLQIDHIQPIALGGKTELANLRLLCGIHNRRRAEKTFGARPATATQPLSSPDACAGTESHPGSKPDPS